MENKEQVELQDKINIGFFIRDCEEEYKKESTVDNDFIVWDELFGILAWEFKPTRSGDMFLDASKVYEVLKNKFELKRK
jgi:hypothetical protein